jgi:hypothetical protein
MFRNGKSTTTNYTFYVELLTFFKCCEMLRNVRHLFPDTDGNALPSAGTEWTVGPTLLNDPAHQTASAESEGEDAGGGASLSNDPQEQTASANSAGEVEGVAANRQAGNAAAVLASMIQHPPPPPPFTMPISANEVSLAQARALMKVAKINEKARKKREREEDADMFTDVDNLKKN